MYRSRLASVLAMVALAAILLPTSLTAQITFQRTYGGTGRDTACSVQQTADGGYIIAGTTESYGAGRQDVYLVRTDAYGDTLWTRTFGGDASDYGRSVRQTTDGGFIVAGITQSFGSGSSDIYLVRTDAEGDTVWTRTFGGQYNDEGHSVLQTADSGYAVVGSCIAFHGGWGDADVCLIKTDAGGTAQWVQTYGIINWDYGYSVQQTTDGGYVITGGAYAFAGGSAYVLRADAKGDEMWTTTYGVEVGSGQSVQQTADDGFVVAGNDAPINRSHASLLKFGADGDSLWSQTYASGVGYSVQQTADSGFVIAGCTGTEPDAYLIKTDANGDVAWTKAFGGQGNDVGHSIQQTADGGYIIAGYTCSFGDANGDMYVIKTDALGNVAVAEPRTSPMRMRGLTVTCEPNPCRGATTVRLSPFATRSSPLVLRIYDAQGRAVRSLSSLLSAPFSLTWDGTDELGQPLPSGAYFVRVDAGTEHATTRIVLQR